MKREDCAARLKRVHVCQPIIAVFKADGIAGLARLNAIGPFGVEFKDRVLILGILESQIWDNDQNRKVEFYIASNDYADEFAMAIADSIDRLELGHDHDLRALQSGRQKMRDDAAVQITETFLAPAIAELDQFGVSVAVSVEVINPGQLTVMTAAVRDDGNTIGQIQLDGFTGRLIMPDGEFTDECSYATPEMVTAALMGIVEAATSAV